MIEPGGADDTHDISSSSQPPSIPPPAMPPPPAPKSNDFNLGVAQIVITAATPMTEEPDKPFPPPPTEDPPPEEPEETATEEPPEYTEVCEEKLPQPPPPLPTQEEPEDPTDDQPTDSAPFPISSSTGSEEDTYTGPSTAENSQSQPATVVITKKSIEEPKDVIPDELEPHQLARLQDLKESDA